MSRMARRSVPCTPAPAGSGWPGMNNVTAEEFSRIGNGQPISRKHAFAQIHVRSFWINDYATTGHTRLTFFSGGTVTNGSAQTNLPTGIYADDRPMWLTGLVVTPVDFTSAGARNVADSATAGSVWDNASQAAVRRFSELRTIMQAGRLTLKVADRQIFETCGLDKFPAGGGLMCENIQYTQAAAALGGVAAWSNGLPVAGNTFRFPRPYPVLPGKPIRVDLEWAQALVINVAAGMKVELIGESVQPLNQ